MGEQRDVFFPFKQDGMPNVDGDTVTQPTRSATWPGKPSLISATPSARTPSREPGHSRGTYVPGRLFPEHWDQIQADEYRIRPMWSLKRLISALMEDKGWMLLRMDERFGHLMSADDQGARPVVGWHMCRQFPPILLLRKFHVSAINPDATRCVNQLLIKVTASSGQGQDIRKSFPA